METVFALVDSLWDISVPMVVLVNGLTTCEYEALRVSPLSARQRDQSCVKRDDNVRWCMVISPNVTVADTQSKILSTVNVEGSTLVFRIKNLANGAPALGLLHLPAAPKTVLKLLSQPPTYLDDFLRPLSCIKRLITPRGHGLSNPRGDAALAPELARVRVFGNVF
ncbi:hypothetical protein SELMODRAFT_413671 [Selaginella moellendorffii]|uniref:Uncharacterized protein n=1 Tax=Selaginella moellendorffii TaxID=88036 RepID=D8RPU7_SELML|nr:hypothetical protein SELMODRAFT_413671 [Selaginella moellendorffii]